MLLPIGYVTSVALFVHGMSGCMERDIAFIVSGERWRWWILSGK